MGQAMPESEGGARDLISVVFYGFLEFFSKNFVLNFFEDFFSKNLFPNFSRIYFMYFFSIYFNFFQKFSSTIFKIVFDPNFVFTEFLTLVDFTFGPYSIISIFVWFFRNLYSQIFPGFFFAQIFQWARVARLVLLVTSDVCICVYVPLLSTQEQLQSQISMVLESTHFFMWLRVRLRIRIKSRIKDQGSKKLRFFQVKFQKIFFKDFFQKKFSKIFFVIDFFQRFFFQRFFLPQIFFKGQIFLLILWGRRVGSYSNLAHSISHNRTEIGAKLALLYIYIYIYIFILHIYIYIYYSVVCLPV